MGIKVYAAANSHNTYVIDFVAPVLAAGCFNDGLEFNVCCSGHSYYMTFYTNIRV